jgi:hypothetical protein
MAIVRIRRNMTVKPTVKSHTLERIEFAKDFSSVTLVFKPTANAGGLHLWTVQFNQREVDQLIRTLGVKNRLEGDNA